MPNKIKGYLIDVKAKKITQIEYTGNDEAELKEIKSLLGYDSFEGFALSSNINLYTSSTSDNIQGTFTWIGEPWDGMKIVNNAMIVGYNEDGESVDANITIEEIQKKIKFPQ